MDETMGRLVIEDVTVEGDRTVRYDLSGSFGLRKYLTGRDLWVRYERDVSEVPESILAIPGVTTLCSLAWFLDSELVVEELDATASRSLSDVREGYRRMLDVDALGTLSVATEVDNGSPRHDDVGLLFTGGVDSTATYLRHCEASPHLIAVGHEKMGEATWKRRKDNVSTFAESEGIEPHFVESNLKGVVDRRFIDLKYRDEIGRGWWGGMQYGIALMGICAPLTYTSGIGTLYQGSGYTRDPTYPTAQPYVVDPLAWAGTSCEIDAPDWSRQEKLELISTSVDSFEQLWLDSCVSPDEAICCRCRKCYRTLMGLLATGTDPSRLGFDVDSSITAEIRHALEAGDVEFDEIGAHIWRDIQAEMDEKTYPYDNDEFVNWFNEYLIETEEASDSNPAKRRVVKGLPSPIDYFLYRTYVALE